MKNMKNNVLIPTLAMDIWIELLDEGNLTDRPDLSIGSYHPGNSSLPQSLSQQTSRPALEHGSRVASRSPWGSWTSRRLGGEDPSGSIGRVSGERTALENRPTSSVAA
jgi:hypothetical protein